MTRLAAGDIETLDIPGGPAELLLLHEGLGSVSMWREFPAQLADATGARVVAYSRFGFGRSSPRTTPYGLRFMHEEAEEVLPALREALGLARPVLVGHSTGASMALLHAVADPGGVAGVVAMAPFVDVEPGNLASIAQAREQWRTTDWREKLARHHDDVDAVFRAWNDTWLDPAFARWSIAADLAQVRCPVLALVGDADPYSTPRQLRLVEASITSAPVRALVLAGCGHVPHREQPAIVLREVAAFLAESEKLRFER